MIFKALIVGVNMPNKYSWTFIIVIFLILKTLNEIWFDFSEIWYDLIWARFERIIFWLCPTML